jgi:bifunctional UDP-N-acetylglucosamine pyrophosphorylase/glucosamine-1-phosphate N-acetyltransferase
MEKVRNPKSAVRNNVTAIIMAAGKGTRMKSERSKVLHDVAGKPMLGYVIDACQKAGVKDIVLISGANYPEIREFTRITYPNGGIKIVIQKKQLGTAHAISTALKAKIKYEEIILILSGDVPLIEPDTIRNAINEFTIEKPGGIILTSKVDNPFGYGRIVRDAHGFIESIVEQKDATPEQQEIDHINGGVYIFNREYLKKYISRIKMNPLKKEYYLTDIAGIMAENGIKIRPLTVAYAEVAGINDRVQLMEAGKMKNKKTLERFAKNGITIVDFDTVFIDENVSIGADTVIQPFTVIRGSSRIGKGCNIGPFAHIRPGTVIGDNCRVGNYVEIKKSTLGNNTFVSHLSYIGDAELGSNVNIGAGTITCNYDGFKKHKTIIGDNVFVGSDTKFVAPVKVGRGAIIAAGSVITGDVPADALSVARARQVNKEKWALKRRKKK